MMTYNEMLLARQRYEDLNKVRGRAEIEPVTVTTNVLANALVAVKAAFAPNTRKATRTARTSRTAAHQALAAK